MMMGPLPIMRTDCMEVSFGIGLKNCAKLVHTRLRFMLVDKNETILLSSVCMH